LITEKRDREAQEKLDKQREALEEAERIAAEKKKKKPIRYPTEDLDVRLTDKDGKAGMKVKRPVPSRVAIPFNDTPGTFEAFLMAWNFLIVYGYESLSFSLEFMPNHFSSVNLCISPPSPWTNLSMPSGTRFLTCLVHCLQKSTQL